MTPTDTPDLHELRLTPEVLLRAYSAGIFPMAETREDRTLFWVDPEQRGILPLDRVRVSKRLRRTLRKNVFEIRANTAFDEVLHACAEKTDDRPETWINDDLLRLYTELHRMGHAHSIESWLDGKLVGGLYGVSLKGAFFGESMFSRVTDASKVALVHLVARLKADGFTLLDTQFVTDHLKQFGAMEIPRYAYLQMLNAALHAKASFYSDFSSGDANELVDGFLQSITQTS